MDSLEERNFPYIPDRYDLLCIEGIARALNVFLGKTESPHYRLVTPPGGDDNILTVNVHEQVCSLSSIA